MKIDIKYIKVLNTPASVAKGEPNPAPWHTVLETVDGKEIFISYCKIIAIIFDRGGDNQQIILNRDQETGEIYYSKHTKDYLQQFLGAISAKDAIKNALYLPLNDQEGEDAKNQSTLGSWEK